MDLVRRERVHDTLDLAQEVFEHGLANGTRSVQCHSNINHGIHLHAGHNSIHVPALAACSHPCVVTFNCRFQLHTEQFSPVHLGLRELLDKTLDTCGQVTCAIHCSGSRQHGFFNLILNLLTLFCCELGTTLAFFLVAIAIAILFLIAFAI